MLISKMAYNFLQPEGNEFKVSRYSIFPEPYQTFVISFPLSDRYENSESLRKENFRPRDRGKENQQNFLGFKTKLQNAFWYYWKQCHQKVFDTVMMQEVKFDMFWRFTQNQTYRILLFLFIVCHTPLLFILFAIDQRDRLQFQRKLHSTELKAFHIYITLPILQAGNLKTSTKS